MQIRAIDNSTAPGGIVTALAGTPMLKAYEFAAALNRTVVGGNGRSVALGGFLTGGGHSLLAPRYGLASDLVLEMEVVTPQGEIKTINECSDPELFWAFRGGGGSTFGVLLSATFLTVPTPKVVNVNFALTTLSYNPNAWMGMAHFVSKFPKLADAGVSGYPLLFRDVTVPALPGIPLTIAAGLFIMTDPPGNDGGIAHLRSLLNPLFQEVNATYGSLQAPWFIETNYTTYNSYLDWFRNNWDPTPVGTDQVVTSRLLDEKALTGNLTALAAALRTFTAPNGGQSTVFLVSGKGVHEWQTKVRGAIGSAGTAVVPAWRKTYVHATSTITFPARNLTARAKALQDVESFVSPLRELTPDMGAYMNEVSRAKVVSFQT